MNLPRILDTAVQIVQEAGPIARASFGHAAVVREKAHGDYATEGDLRVEAFILDRLERAFPDHAWDSEERGRRPLESEFVWILDPIDGTDNFVHAMATFGTLVALCHEGLPVLGVIDHPRLDLRVSAAYGLGASCNGRPVRVADRNERGAPIVIATAPENFVKGGRPELFGRLATAYPNLRVYRDCYAHSVVLQGQGAVAIDWHAQLWDVCAAWAIAREAGAAFVRLGGPAGRYQVVFGRPAAVAAVTDLLGVAQEGT